MHIANYPGEENVALYILLFCVINVPWTFLALRKYIVVPVNPRMRTFVIIFDIILTKP